MVQVQEVVGVMRNNIDKVLERDSKLSDLDNRSEPTPRNTRRQTLDTRL